MKRSIIERAKDAFAATFPEPPAPDIVTDYAGNFESAVEAFKRIHPDLWESLRLCPLQHGLDEMLASLKG